MNLSTSMIECRLGAALVLGWLLAGLCAPVGAQSKVADYCLGPADVVDVIVLRHDNYSGEFLVAPDGTIDLPGAGKVKATGHTLIELQGEITAILTTRLRDPEVTVTLHTPRQQRVFVLGAVKAPGPFDLKGTWHISEALAAAGGVMPVAGGEQVPDARDCTVTLLSLDGKQQRWTLADILAARAGTNTVLAAGDVLTVDVLQLIPVYLMGAVQHPGMCALHPGQGVVEALALAGGLSLSPGDVRVTLLRDHVNQSVDLRSTDRQPLQRGDVLTVDPLRAIHVTVAGQVQQPGVYDLKAGEGVMTAITLAGGATELAALRHVTVNHVTGQREDVDVTAAMRAGKTEPAVKLNTGDLVVVPLNTHAVAVLGYVTHPGYYPLPEDKAWTLSEVLGMASGPQGKAAGLNRVALLHTDENGKQVRQVVNVEKFFKNGDSSNNPAIQPGDVVFVPETSSPDWGLIFQAITSYAVFKSAVK